MQSHMRIADKEIKSDLIGLGTADIILSVEPMEALRYVSFLKPGGWIVTNTTPFNNITDYPDQKELMSQLNEQPNIITVDADSIAADLKSKRSSNIVMLGAATPFFQVPFSSFEEGIRKIFARKGEEVVNVNLEALRAGRAYAEKNK